jgi:hypothetical protein
MSFKRIVQLKMLPEEAHQYLTHTGNYFKKNLINNDNNEIHAQTSKAQNPI